MLVPMLLVLAAGLGAGCYRERNVPAVIDEIEKHISDKCMLARN